MQWMCELCRKELNASTTGTDGRTERHQGASTTHRSAHKAMIHAQLFSGRSPMGDRHYKGMERLT
jgi:hypothetical protein